VADNRHINKTPADWADTAVFLAVLDHGNLAAAGESLGLSQPTVGRRLAALEARLGTSLFARTGRRLVPTDMAHQIEESARRMAMEMSAIERMATGAAQTFSGVVTISATEGTGSEWLVSVLQPLRERYPDIVIELIIETRNADLSGREADLALRLSRPVQLDLIARHIADVGFGLYAAPGFIQQHGPFDRPETLMEAPWIQVELGPSQNSLTSQFLAQLDFIPGDLKLALRTNSLAAQIRAVQAGLGVGALSHRWASMAGGLERILPDMEIGSLELWLVAHEDLRRSARIRAVSDYIADAAHRDAALFRHGGVS